MNSSARRFFALAVLLLSSQLAAAQRDDEQSLQGLKNIEVVVKYGQVTGEPEKWQADILQTLEVINRQIDEFIKVFKAANNLH